MKYPVFFGRRPLGCDPLNDDCVCEHPNQCYFDTKIATGRWLGGQQKFTVRIKSCFCSL